MARNARDVGSSSTLGTVFPIFITPTTIHTQNLIMRVSVKTITRETECQQTTFSQCRRQQCNCFTCNPVIPCDRVSSARCRCCLESAQFKPRALTFSRQFPQSWPGFTKNSPPISHSSNYHHYNRRLYIIQASTISVVCTGIFLCVPNCC